MTPSLLEVDSVSLAFGGLQALSDVSVRVDEGTVVGLIGPNGAGKTTLFNVISGLVRADRGTVHFRGADLTLVDGHGRTALGIGRSFQNLGLVNDETVLINLLGAQHVAAGYQWWDALVRPRRWWLAERRLRDRAQQSAELFGITEWLDHRVADLSFAVARFCELACVLTQRPRMMLLDEPTTGLDLRETEQLLALLRAQRAEGTTILLVAHDVRFVMQLCDHIYVLSEGRVLFDGAPSEVQYNRDVIAAYLGKAGAA